jgi:hypothetical protein
MLRRLSLTVALSLLLPVALSMIACGGDDETAPDDPVRIQVETTIREAIDAYNRGDAAAFLSYWTDEGLKSEFEATRDQITAAADQFFGGPPRVLRDLGNTKVKGNSATAEADFTLGRSIEREELALVKQGDAWKIDGTDPLQVPVPSRTTAIGVKMDEFVFTYDPAKIKDGNVVFRISNAGEQAHELVLLRVPEDFNLQAALASDQLPAGIEFVGGIAPKAPKESANLVFTEALMAGRYMMLCFLPDTSDPLGTPHVVKGMASDFAIPAQGGGR